MHERDVSIFQDHPLFTDFRVDFACKSRKIAVKYEFDESFTNKSNATGTTLFERRVFKKLGWKTVYISGRDIDGRSVQTIKDMLQTRLQSLL